MTPEGPQRDNLRGGLWLLADLSLNIWALSIVKALGLGYPPAQLVFLRAIVGLVVISPWIWRDRHVFRRIDDPAIHLLRLALSVVTLNASFYAIARLPFALFTTVNFTRPLLMMLMAALVLREPIGRRRWLAAGVALIGVVIAMNPETLGETRGLAALILAVVSGSAAIIATRRLRAAPRLMLMTFYTLGLSLSMAPLAALNWQPIPPGHLPALLGIGLFAQLGQLCFLRAHYLGEAGYLAILGYLSLILSGSVGYFIFGEVPSLRFCVGAVLVVTAAIWVARGERKSGP